MAALNERQRAFVCALFDAPRKKGRVKWATLAAKYGRPGSSDASIRSIGGRLMGSDKIRAAIAEESPKRLRGLAPAAISAIADLIRDPKHRDHARALAMVVDRADPVETTHTVNVNDTRGPPPMALEKVMARIEELARKFNAPALPAPVVVEGECREVPA